MGLGRGSGNWEIGDSIPFRLRLIKVTSFLFVWVCLNISDNIYDFSLFTEIA